MASGLTSLVSVRQMIGRYGFISHRLIAPSPTTPAQNKPTRPHPVPNPIPIRRTVDKEPALRLHLLKVHEPPVCVCVCVRVSRDSPVKSMATYDTCTPPPHTHTHTQHPYALVHERARLHGVDGAGVELEHAVVLCEELGALLPVVHPHLNVAHA